jgi:hypothetical protein
MSLFADRICSHGAATSSCATYAACSPCRHSKRVQRARLVLARSERRELEPSSGALKALVSDEAGISASTAGASKSAPIREDLVKTRYIAETLLPTRHGNFRLRGYKHSVSCSVASVAGQASAVHHLTACRMPVLPCSWTAGSRSQNQRQSSVGK